MPWNDIPNFTAGQVLTSGTMNDLLENTEIGHVVCTSSTRPASPDTGAMIYETDTQKVLTWDGSAWVESLTGTSTIATSQLSGTIPTSSLTGTYAASSLSGTVPVANMPSGSVIQAVQRISSGYQYVFSNFLYTECYCYITPLISTSKILVMAHACIWTTSSSDGGYGGGIYSNVGGQLIQVSRIGHGFDETGDEANAGTFTYLRSDHNTTGSHYYQLTADPYRNNSGTGVWCNRSYQQTDYSVMTLLELK